MMRTILHSLRHPFHPCKNTRGTAAVEVGLTILPFMLAFFGVIEMGMYYFHQHTIQFAAHEGMRVGLLGATLEDSGGTQLTRADSITKAIVDNSNYFITIDPSDIDINPVGALAGVPINAGTAGQLMKVQVNYTHEFITPLIGGFFGAANNFVLHAEGTYRNEAFLGGGSGAAAGS